MDDEQDVKRGVYAELLAQSKNPPTLPDEDNVARYHLLLDDLARIGYTVDRFRIDRERDMFRPHGRFQDAYGRPVEPKLRVRAGVLENKVSALLTYFELEGRGTVVDVGLLKSR